MVTYRLRALEPGDLGVLLSWENNPSHWIAGQRSSPFSKDSLEKYIAASGRDFWETGQMRWVLCEAYADRPLGLIDVFGAKRIHLRAEVGILIAPEMRGQGLARAGMRLLQAWARDYAMLETLSAQVYTDNAPALATFTQAGFTRSGTWQRWVKTPQGWKDVALFQWSPDR